MTVIELVDRERARLRASMALVGLAVAGGAAAGILALATLSLGGARWIALPRPLPVAAWIVVAALGGAVAWWTIVRLRRSASRLSVATEIERERALRTGSLRGAIEVADSGTLGRRGAQLLGEKLQRQGPALAPELQRRARGRALLGVAGAALAIVTLAAARSASPDGWRALAHPVAAWKGTLAPPLTIVAPRLVLRGERVTVRVAAVDRRVVTLSQRATGTPWRTSRHPVADTTAQMTLGPVDADVMLVATDGRTVSDTVVIRVTDRPFVGEVSLRARFPGYLRRPEEVIPTGEPARLPRGTVLTITGQASTALESVRLARGDDTVRLEVDGHAFGGRLFLQETGRWTWTAKGVSAEIADVPAPLEIDVIPDSAPRVEIVSPANDTLVTGRDTIELDLAAVDDHGLASVALRTWRQPAAGRPQPVTEARLSQPAATQWTGGTRIDVAGRGLKPGDALHIVAVAVDASPWAQSTSSRELIIRIPTASEQREMARDASDSAVAEALAAVSAQRDLERRTAEAARARGQRSNEAQSPSSSNASDEKPMSFEQAEKARALGAEQRAMEQQVEELQKAAAAMEEQLRQAGALDSGLASRLAEARALLDQALTPELRAQMQKLEEALRKLSAEDAQSALSDLREQQERLREQLERSAEMLKRAALEGSMQTLRDEAKELAEQERALADSVLRSLQRQNPDSGAADRARQAAELQDRARELSKDVSQLSERLTEENAQTGAKKTSDAGKQAEQSAAAMERAAKAMPQPKTGGEQKAGEQKAGEQKPGDPKAAQPQAGEPRAGEQKAGEQKASTPGQQGQQGQQQGQQGQQQGQQGQQGQQQGQQGQQGAQAANEAAEAMERAAQQLADARKSQIDEWKSELTGELDQSIQEMLQLARQQERLEQQLKQGADAATIRGEQGALQAGVQKAGERLEQAGQKSSLLSAQSKRAAGEAQSKVEQATREVSEPRSAAQTQSAMREASEALNRAAASLVRDRERANNAKSASGFAEMLEQMQEMAQRQGGVNAQAMSLLQSGMGSAQAQAQARELAKQQRGVARDLSNLGDATGKSEDLAREAQRIAEALDAGRLDPATVQRQQQLFRRMLDAGRTLEQNERDESGKREAQAAKEREGVTPDATGRARDAVRFREPTWNELRGLTPEERRAVLEYFKRINGGGTP